MTKGLDAETKKQVVAHVNYYREMGIYDFYRQSVAEGTERAEDSPAIANSQAVSAEREAVVVSAGKESLFDSVLPVGQDKPAALKTILEDIGDWTPCRLRKGRKNIGFEVGKPDA